MATIRWSLRWRVIAVLALAVIAPVVVVGAMSMWRARKDVELEVNAGALTHIRAIGAGLDTALQDARRTVEFAATQWANDANVVGNDAHRAQRLMRLLKKSVPMLASVSLVNRAGVLTSGDPLPPHIELGRDSFGGYVGDVVEVDGRREVYLVVQARQRNGELVGAVVCAIDVEFVRSQLARAQPEATSSHGAVIYVVDGGGNLIASTAAISAPSVEAAVKRGQANVFEGTFEHGDALIAYRNLSGFQSLRGVNWIIVHEQPTAQAYRLARAAARDTLIIAAIALALALLIGGWLASRLTRPLAALAQRADEIASARTPRSLASSMLGPGEIGVLAKRFEEMAGRVAEREDLQVALARGDRLASVGVMSAQLAHEINNPLTTVLGYANLLLEDKPNDHPDYNGLQLIADEAARMKSIVAELLRYARADSIDESLSGPDEGGCDLQLAVAHALSLALPQLRKSQLQVSNDIAPDIRLAVPGRALEQVLVNLIQNAIHATNGEGHIKLRGQLKPGRLAAEIIISDNGSGIDEAHRARIFDPFFSTKRSGVGTGLGLAVCKHLISSAGGSIELQSSGPASSVRSFAPFPGPASSVRSFAPSPGPASSVRSFAPSPGADSGATFVITLPVLSKANS
jgi:signal transduction histidine kinase